MWALKCPSTFGSDLLLNGDLVTFIYRYRHTNATSLSIFVQTLVRESLVSRGSTSSEGDACARKISTVASIAASVYLHAPVNSSSWKGSGTGTGEEGCKKAVIVLV